MGKYGFSLKKTPPGIWPLFGVIGAGLGGMVYFLVHMGLNPENVFDRNIIQMFKVLALSALAFASPMQFCPNGICPEIVGIGKHCGGFMASAPQCGPGLYCKLSHVADAGGVCLNDADSKGIPFGAYCDGNMDCVDGTFCSNQVCERRIVA
ncbi:hypothetical protein HDV06_005507 [Boothiomyces sp. JEL0866]|nr:hypothetical protein HDV06_005507 [Boothiomyces sp. JEL0866]